jgi:cytoskeletal protein CcmA (bactofilin family)
VRGVVEGIVGIEDQLVVDAGGRVDADARVSGADVFGEIRGELTTRSLLRIRSGGSVEGRIRAPRLRVDPGGLLQGTIARSEPAAENPLSQPPDVNSQPA